MADPVGYSMTRRGLLSLVGAGGVAVVLSACRSGGSASAPAAPTSAATSSAAHPSAATVAPTAAASAATTSPPTVTTASTAAATASTPVATRATANVQGTLNAAFSGTQVSAADKTVSAGFQKEYPKATVNWIPVQGTDWPQYFTKILTMIAAGTTPDVMDVATEGVQLFAGKGLSQPIDDYVKQDQAAIQEYFSDVHPVLVEAMMYQGHLYQLPHDWNSRYVYLNTKLFQDAKVAFPASDWDKDAFYKTTQSLTKQGGGPPYGFGWENRLMGGWLHWVVMNGSNLLSEDHWPGGDWLWNTFYKDDPTAKGHKGGWHWGEPTANAAANVEALDFLVQMAKENLTPAVQVGGGSLLEGFFTSNKLAMTPGGGFWAGGLHQAGMKPDAFDIQVFPKWKTQRNVFGTAGLALMQKAKDKDLAWEYMKYRIRKDVIGVILADNSSTPPRRSMMTTERYVPTGPKNWQEYYAAIEKFPSLPLPTPPWYQELNTIVTKYTSLIMTFSQSPKDGLENMQKDLDAAYKTFQSGG